MPTLRRHQHSWGDLHNNILSYELKYLPIAIILHLLLKKCRLNEIDFLLCRWAKKYQSLIHLIGAEHGDE